MSKKRKIDEAEDSKALRTLVKDNVLGLTVRVATTEDFWAIMDFLKDELDNAPDEKGFYNNRIPLLEAFQRGEMYVQYVNKVSLTREMRRNMAGYAGRRPYAYITVSGFCCWDGNAISFIWTHKNMRNLHIATRFVKHFNPKSVADVLQESIKFWEKLNIKIDTVHF